MSKPMDKPATPLPCPFCGGEANVRQYQYRGTGASGMETPKPYIRCAKCGAEQPRVECDDSPYGRANNRKTYVQAEAEAVAAWNRRVPHLTAINAELVELLRGFVMSLTSNLKNRETMLTVNHDELVVLIANAHSALARAKENSND